MTVFTDVEYAIEEADFLAEKQGPQKVMYSAELKGFFVVNQSSNAVGLYIETIHPKKVNKYNELICPDGSARHVYNQRL